LLRIEGQSFVVFIRPTLELETARWLKQIRRRKIGIFLCNVNEFWKSGGRKERRIFTFQPLKNGNFCQKKRFLFYAL
jgi:hypothetical protein